MLRMTAATPGAADLHPLQRMVLAYTKATATIGLFFERGRQRRALAQLDEHLMRDLGLSRSVVQREARKHFWQV